MDDAKVEDKFLAMQSKFEDPRISLKQFTRIRREIFLRHEFIYSISQYIKSYVVCCLRGDNIAQLKERKMFDKARSKLNKELDIVNILRSMRKQKLMSKILLKTHHRRLIMLFQ
jgi:RNA polymerase-interacting CarD/CdnL/TRCF family regulator